MHSRTQRAPAAHPRRAHWYRLQSTSPQPGSAQLHPSPSLVRTGPLLLAGLLACGSGAARDAVAPATGHFLVARPDMADPRFRRTVILLVRYGAGGAIGLVVNRASDVTLAEAFPLLAPSPASEALLWLGGPVEQGRPALLVESPQPPQDALAVVDSVYFSRSVALLRTLADSGGARFRVYAGYAGWGPGQLDGELARDAWRVVPASAGQIFSDDGDALWRALDAASTGTWVRTSPARARSPALASRPARALPPRRVAGASRERLLAGAARVGVGLSH